MRKMAEWAKVVAFGAILLGTAGMSLVVPKLAGVSTTTCGPCSLSKYCDIPNAASRIDPARPTAGSSPTQSPTQVSPRSGQGSKGPETGKAAFPVIQTFNENGRWVIKGKRVTAELDPENLRLTAKVRNEAGAPGAPAWDWAFLPSSAGDLVVKDRGSVFPLRLADAGQKSVEPYATGYLTGIKITLSGFLSPSAEPRSEPSLPSGAPPSPSPAPISDAAPASVRPRPANDLAIQLFLGLEGRDEDLVVRVIASDGETRARELFFPASVDAAAFDETVVPFMQGMLLPKDWPRAVRLYDEISYGRGLYMPWWGHVKRDGAGIVAILETPADAGIRFSHPAGGPTRADVRFEHSLGRWSHPRTVRYAFTDGGGYVALAKRYRRYAVETGHFVPLKEKIARNPLVGRLVGAPVIHTSILYHIQPDSSYYKKDDPAANHQLVTFDARAAELRRLAARGVTRAYVHLDGWGVRGYDNLHPDILPPSPEAGGWDGMRRFADECGDLGFVFAVHDQYRDFYRDAPSYDPRRTVLNEDGTRPEHATWYGGRQSILCPSLAPGFVRRNFGELLAQGVKVRGAYLDVFAVVPGDECYGGEHPVSRGDCLRDRAECLDFVRSFGGVASSEEPADWAIPHVDLVHHAPHALDPNPGSGPAMGVPIPLYSLVYHDALLVPWSLGKGAWGIPESDLGFLYGMGNAGLPYLSIDASDEELARVRAMCALNERVGLAELVDHEFVGRGTAGTAKKAEAGRDGKLAAATPWAAFTKQRFTYADGTTVTIDLAAGTYSLGSGLSKSLKGL